MPQTALFEQMLVIIGQTFSLAVSREISDVAINTINILNMHLVSLVFDCSCIHKSQYNEQHKVKNHKRSNKHH